MQDIETIWKQILEKLELRISSVSFMLWIKTIKPLEIDENGNFILVAQSVTAKNQILRNFLDKIDDCANEVTGKSFKITILDQNEEVEYLKNNKVDEKNTSKNEEKSPFKEKFTFDNFVVGKSNQFVYAAARTVAEHPGKRYNPLFIYGGVGLGKTHLLHAIGNYIHEFSPNLKIMYVTCEQFTNDYIASLYSPTKNKSIMEFRGKYRNLDVLMVDDIQFISRGKETQEEFFHTFNELIMNNKQIIICSDRPPKDIETLEDRLRSRFSSGLIHDIQAPDIETRIAILHKKSQLEKYYAEDEVINYIAERVDTNIRELEGKLSEVYFLATLNGKKVATMEEAKEVFTKEPKEEIKNDLNPDKIISTVCDYFNIGYQDIIGKKKNKEVVEPRMIAIYLISELLNLPLVNIGKIFGGRDHTTIMHSRDKITDELKTNKKIQNLVSDIKGML
ncbi:MAG TPA: chromosomal replication initiator protein DnaA [Candidatus Caccovivens faecavium]|nr:chromosomal replication initiator protein DnaA [Candidatus Caccovivens faecavium]